MTRLEEVLRHIDVIWFSVKGIFRAIFERRNDMGIKAWVIKKIAIKEINKMLDKLDLKSKRILTLVAIIAWGGVEAYLKHQQIEVPNHVREIIVSLGLGSHYAGKALKK